MTTPAQSAAVSANPADRGGRLSVLDAAAMIVGVIVGAGVFRTPSLVASNAGSEGTALFAWVLGGAVSLVGALCYAELATTFPSRGGDYHFISRAFGRSPAFLYAWSRVAVIQTGSIAMQAFLVGDFASRLLPLGPSSASIYAAAVVALLTAANAAGLRYGKRLQNVLTLAITGLLVLVILLGLVLGGAGGIGGAGGAGAAPSSGGSFGLAMVFVLLTYGGWSEAAYLSADVDGGGRRGRPAIVKAILLGIAAATLLYVALNVVLLRVLGFSAVASSEAVGADMLRRLLGPSGEAAISAVVVVAALSTVNATIFTGARTAFALGRDFRALGLLGRWREDVQAPVPALLVQGAVALLLVLLGTMTRTGFATMVEYTAPVFWLFLTLAAASLFVLRRKEPHVTRPFRVPFYPLLPIAFVAASLFMLRASLLHAGPGAWVGVAVLLAGVPLLLFASRSGDARAPAPPSGVAGGVARTVKLRKKEE